MGVLHGVGSAVHKIFRDIKGKADKRTNLAVSFICIVGNCIFVAFLWVVFRATDIGQAMEVLSGLEDGTYRDPYHVEPIELTKKRQRNILLVQHLLGWARYLF